MSLSRRPLVSLTDFLASFAARAADQLEPREGLQRAAQRFAALVSSAATKRPRAVNADVDPAGLTLSIVSGLHCGASIELVPGAYKIGSDAACDIVLRDVGIAPRHCSLLIEAGGFSLRDVRTESPRLVSPHSVHHDETSVDSIYELAGVRLLLTCRIPESQREQPKVQAPSPRSTVRYLGFALAGAMVLTAFAWATVHRPAERTASLAERIVEGGKALAAQEFNAVRFRQGLGSELEVTGLVANSDEQQRLRTWLARSDYDGARFNVQSAANLLEQVRHMLGASELNVRFDGAYLRIEGETQQLTVKDRIRLLRQELQGVVRVVDSVAYVDGPARRRDPGPMPVRVRDVMIGSPSYFRTESGVRYFEGALLPDGAEVLAIEPAQIRFRLAGQMVVYDLD